MLYNSIEVKMINKAELNNLIKFYKTYKTRPIEDDAMENKLIILNNFLNQIIEKSKELNINSSEFEIEKQNIKKELNKHNINLAD